MGSFRVLNQLKIIRLYSMSQRSVLTFHKVWKWSTKSVTSIMSRVTEVFQITPHSTHLGRKRSDLIRTTVKLWICSHLSSLQIRSSKLVLDPFRPVTGNLIDINRYLYWDEEVEQCTIRYKSTVYEMELVHFFLWIQNFLIMV